MALTNLGKNLKVGATGALAPSLPVPATQPKPAWVGTPPSRAPSVTAGILANVRKELGASVAPTSSSRPGLGQAGGLNSNAGNIAGAGSSQGYNTTASSSFGFVTTWQAANQSLDLALRIGLPVVGAFLLVKGHTAFGAAALGVGGLLWVSRVAGSTAATTTASGHLAADLVTPISPLLYPGQGSTYVNPMDPYEVR